MGVERQVVGGEAHVGVEEQLEPALLGDVDRAARAPEQPVVDEDQARVERGGAVEELEPGADACDNGCNLAATGYLESVRSVVVEGGRDEQVVEEAGDPIDGRHR